MRSWPYRFKDERQSRRFGSGVAVAVIFVLCACDAGGSPETIESSVPEPTSTSAAIASSIAPGSGLVTEFGLSTDEEVAFVFHRDRLISECMLSEGFEYKPTDVAQVREEIHERQAATIPLPLSSAVAPTSVSATQAIDPNLDYVDGLSEDEAARYHVALTGNPDEDPALFTLPDGTEITVFRGGCWNQSRETMFGDLATAIVGEMTVANADVAVGANVSLNPSVINAMTAWSDCMNQSGYRFSSYVEAAVARDSMADGESAKMEAIDRTCSDEHDLYNVVVRAIEDAKLAVAAEQGEAITDYLRLRADVARAAIASGEGG